MMNAKNLRPVRVHGAIAFVPLTQGCEAIVDADDAALVGQHNWHLHRCKGALAYARIELWNGGDRIRLFLHRFLTQPEPGYVIDHIDGDGLNNRRSNLRVCLHKENIRNRVSRKLNGLPKGVHPYGRRFKSWIQADGIVYQLGVFDTPEEAGEAYRRAAEDLHGVFARYR